MNLNKNFNTTLLQCQERIHGALDKCLQSSPSAPPTLLSAMRYSALNGGKRLRATIVYLTGLTFDIPWEDLDSAACAVEMIHAYSLIHDDLPAMDDSPLRRGKPSCHLAFDEATAILAGDALHSLAFEVLAKARSDVARVEKILILSEACGAEGMAGGQVIDLTLEKQQSVSLAELERMHRLKTGVLIEASALMAIAAVKPQIHEEVNLIKEYSRCLGLAFQIQDDILDVEGDVANLGKPKGGDVINAKATYASILGLEEAKSQALKWKNEALACLNQLPRDTHLLEALANYIIEREY